MGILDFLTGGSAARVFLWDGKNPTTPKQFGYAVVKSAIDNTPSDVREMYGSRTSEVQQKIYQKAQGAQLALIALQTAVIYVYALRVLEVPRDVLTELFEGMTKGFEKLLGDGEGNTTGTAFAGLLEKLLRLYSKSLFDELTNASPNEDLMGLGPTAALVVQTIAELCEVQKDLASNALERIKLMQIAERNGILLLLGFADKNSITYRP